MEIVDFNFLSKHGLIYQINKEVLHPLGLALSYNEETGTSPGCIVDDSDFRWEYTDDITEEYQEKFEKFKANYRKTLKEKVKD